MVPVVRYCYDRPDYAVLERIVEELWNFVQEKPLSSVSDEMFWRRLADKNVEGNAISGSMAYGASEGRLESLLGPFVILS